MNIYEVVFYGSHGDPDAEDTIYLVRAPDFRAAIEDVARNGSPREHNGCRSDLADAVYELGQDSSPYADRNPRILRGPYFAFAYNCGWRSWVRESEAPGMSGGFVERQIAEPDGPANRSQPIGPGTHRTPPAAGSGG
jgi:hypothetical protein